MKKIFLACLFFLLSSKSVFAADFTVAKNCSGFSNCYTSIQSAANAITPGDTVYIRAGIYTEKVVISKTNSTTNYFTFMAYPNENVILDGTGINLNNWGGLVEIRTKYVKFSGLHLQNSSWFGFYILNNNVIIQNNTTYSTKSSGIYANEVSNITVTGNDVQRANDGGCSQECITFESVTNFEIANNQVHNGTGWSESCKGGEGIDVKVSSSNGSVHHNKIYDLPNEVGIYIDGYSGNLHKIDVYNNSSSAPDGIVVSAEQGGQVDDIRIFNNLVFNNDYAGIWVTDWMSGNEGSKGNIQIINNTIYGAANAGIIISAKKFVNSTSLITVNNNILNNNGLGIVVNGTPNNRISQNNNLISGDPKFLSIDPANAGFLKLTSASNLAIDKGTSNFAPTTDYMGTNRPQGGGFDIGAYEHKSSGVINISDFRLLLSTLTSIFNFNTLVSSYGK